MRVISFDTLSSTSDYLKDHIDNFNEPICIQAKHQTNGRGRRGRSWKANDGENLLMSIYHPSVKSNAQALWISALSIVKLIKNHGEQPTIKLPNDILVQGRKISGILIEHLQAKHKIITGIGLNVNETFEDVSINAISLKQLSLKHLNVDTIRDEVLKIYEQLSKLDEMALLQQFKDQLFLNRIYAFHGDKSVEITDIDATFNCKINNHWVSCDLLEFVPPKAR